LVAALGLRKGSVDDWLKRPLADGIVEELKKPLRYQWHEASSGQLDIFVD
jgi:hypothetical protein